MRGERQIVKGRKLQGRSSEIGRTIDCKFSAGGYVEGGGKGSERYNMANIERDELINIEVWTPENRDG